MGDESQPANTKRGEWRVVNVVGVGGAAVVLKERRWQGLNFAWRWWRGLCDDADEGEEGARWCR